MGPNGSGKSTLAQVLAGREDYEVTGGQRALRRAGPARDGARGARPRGRLPRLPVPGRDPRASPTPTSSRRRSTPCASTAARRSSTPSTSCNLVREKHEARAHGRDPAAARRSTRASPAARRSATRSSRWRCSSPRLAILDETDSGLDIDALRIVADGVNALRRPTAPSWSSPTTSGCSTTSCPTACTCWSTAASCAPAARSWRWSSRRRATLARAGGGAGRGRDAPWGPGREPRRPLQPRAPRWRGRTAASAGAAGTAVPAERRRLERWSELFAARAGARRRAPRSATARGGFAASRASASRPRARRSGDSPTSGRSRAPASSPRAARCGWTAPRSRRGSSTAHRTSSFVDGVAAPELRELERPARRGALRRPRRGARRGRASRSSGSASTPGSRSTRSWRSTPPSSPTARCSRCPRG